jgi:ABC-type polysaccharide/polyol phosphate export permease
MISEMIMIKEINLHRKYILQNAVSHFRYQYSGSIIGVFWNFINPLFESLLYIIVFSVLLKFGNLTKGDNYGLYLISGLFPWFVFSELVIKGTNVYDKNRILLISMRIPLNIPLAIELVSSFISSIIYFILLVLINVVSGVTPHWSWLLWPVFSIVILLLAYSLAAILAIFRVFFSDMTEVVRHILTLWRWTMPIIYTTEVFPEQFQPYLRLNPPYTFLEILRNIFLENAFPTGNQVIIVIFWLTIIFTISGFLYSKFEAEIRDNL